MTSFTLIIFRFAVSASVGSCTAVGRGFDRRSGQTVGVSIIRRFSSRKVHWSEGS